jgi:ABC-type polysaccharide/polyol phosphate export permease
MKPEILWSYSQKSATAKDLSQLNPIYTLATSFQFILTSFSDLRPFSHNILSSDA